MFLIFHGDALIGRSDLELGDPPMGVAFGQFEPTDAFAALRDTMKPVHDAAGKERHGMRSLGGLCAKTADGVTLVCADVEVVEAGEADDPFEWEVTCFGIEQPPYEELFPHHAKVYENQFRK